MSESLRICIWIKYVCQYPSPQSRWWLCWRPLRRWFLLYSWVWGGQTGWRWSSAAGEWRRSQSYPFWRAWVTKQQMINISISAFLMIKTDINRLFVTGLYIWSGMWFLLTATVKKKKNMSNVVQFSGGSNTILTHLWHAVIYHTLLFWLISQFEAQ